MCYNCYGDIMDNEKISLTRSEYKKLKNNNGKKRKPRWNNIILFIFIVILFIVLIISLINIIKWNIDRTNSNKNIEDISQSTNIVEVKDNDNTEIIDNDVDKDNPYWNYIKMSLINVDFTDLKKTNKDIIGWIQVNSSNINYPFVQAKDNDYYLSHSIDKSYNKAGWVFMDYRNSYDDFDKNTILYAHGRTDRTMFGSLREVIKKSWFDNKDNHVIKLSTEYENTLWQVFSAYKIPTTSDYLQTVFNSDDDFINFGNMLIKRSLYNFNVNINKNDKILTLSTCHNDKEKIVIHAKLIKKEKR